MKRIFLYYVAGILLLSFAGCGAGEQRYTATYYQYFDTVTTVTGYDRDRQAFEQTESAIREILGRYHTLCDTRNPYRGVANLYEVNAMAGISPVEVSHELFTFLTWAKQMYTLSQGTVDITQGSVTYLWESYRDEGTRVPTEQEIAEARSHTGMDLLVLDEAKSTAYLTDPEARLDVGALGKGYAGERVREYLDSVDKSHYLVNLGGNVCANGLRGDGAPWQIGIQSPRGQDGEFLCTLNIDGLCVVTGGDYQRYYEVDGVRYHHIIDPESGMPATRYRAVSVIYDDSGVADCLATALFILPEEQGREIAASLGAEVIWVYANGSQATTEGFSQFIK